MGQPKNTNGLEALSPHQRLQKLIGANPDDLVGGIFRRGEKGEIITDENSGHFGGNWNDKIRDEFEQFLKSKTNKEVKHTKW